MDKIFYFDYCALVIMSAILFALVYRRLSYGTSNRAFFMLVISMILTTLFDLGMEHLNRAVLKSKNIPLFLPYFFSYGYFLMRNAGNIFFIIYILVMSKPVLKLKKYLKQPLIYIPYGIIAGILVSNFFTDKVFSITHEEGYSRGPMIIMVYVTAILYSFIGIWYMVRCYRYVERDRWTIMLMQYPITFMSLVVQFFWPNLLVEMFSMSISLLLILIMVVKPEDTVDSKSEILNYNEFCLEMVKYQHTKESVSIVIIRLTNSYQVRAELGEKKFNSYVTKIARHLANRFEYYRQSSNIYFDQSGCFFVTLESDKLDMEHIVPLEIGMYKNKLGDLSSYGLRFDKKICTVRYPKDIQSVESLLHFAASFHEMMDPTTIYMPASELVNTKGFHIRNHMNEILDRAVKTKRLEMYYQPIYSFREKSFISAEALVRLNDPIFGFIPPGMFIPAAEQNSFIIPIGDFILEDVFRFISENNFKELGLKYIEINLSVSQCIRRTLCDQIFSLKDSYKIDSEQVNFEITESAYDNSGDILSENIKALSDAGFTISLDDYGTGYSNMQRVLSIPLTLVKVDKSLADNINTKKGRTVVKNTISMMHDIDMHIVVEGVETKDTLDELERMGADYIQGYYFSKPLPEKDFIEFLKKNNRRIS